MEIYILLFILIIYFILGYIIHRSVISPFSIYILSFIMATTLIIANMDNWMVTITPRFLPYIVSAVTAFGLGSLLVAVVCHSAFQEPPRFSRMDPFVKERMTGPFPAKTLAVISCICAGAYIVLQIRQTGLSGGLSAMLRGIYENATSGGNNGFFMTQLREITVAVAEISIFEILVIRYVDRTKKIRLRNLIPVFCFFLLALIATDRNIFIRLGLFSIVLWFLFLASNSEKIGGRIDWKAIGKLVLFIVLFVAAFYALGKLKSYTSNLERMLGIYGGSGLYNFNLFLTYTPFIKPQYGQETFSVLKQTMQAFGLFGGSSQTGPLHGGFITFLSRNGYVYSSNIYSSLMPYVNDFGYWGLWIFPSILGMIFEFLYVKARTHVGGFQWVLYSMLAYALAYAAVAEQFFKRFHLGMVYEIGWALVVFLVAYRYFSAGALRVRVRKRY